MEWLIRYGGDPENIPLYDCRLSDRMPGRKDPILGTITIVYGLLAQVIYILDLAVMVRKQYRRLSCYKIMIALGVYDMAAITVNCLLSGYYWLIGANYCTNPRILYATGSLAVGIWCGACMVCFLLAVNRLLDLWNKSMYQMLFQNERTLLVLLLPVLYTLYFFFFTPPAIFNSDHNGMFFFTFVPGHSSKQFVSYPHTVNNIIIVLLTCSLYVLYSRTLLRYSKTGAGISWAQKSFYLQCSAICTANLVAALIYVYMQFFPTPVYFVLVGHICWQLGHCFPALVYLFLNRTIQREVLTLLKMRIQCKQDIAQTRISYIKTTSNDLQF